MTLINVHSFRYDVMLGIYEDYDISLIREQFLVVHVLQHCIVVAIVGTDLPHATLVTGVGYLAGR